LKCTKLLERKNLNFTDPEIQILNGMHFTDQKNQKKRILKGVNLPNREIRISNGLNFTDPGKT
jgi:hypothetical protein